MPPFSHIMAGFSLGWHYRHELARLLNGTEPNSAITRLPPESLKRQGVEALALDFDGVLAPHGFAAPLPEAMQWLTECVATFGQKNICILSNKPTGERRRWFSQHFPDITFISGVRKKPFPDGLKKTGELTGVPLSSILMVDDRLLTGCLAAINAGAIPCYIRAPYISFLHRPFAEIFFYSIRTLERLLVGLLL